MRRMLTVIGKVWVAVWALLFFSAGFTNIFSIPHPWLALDNLGPSALTDWRVLLFWVALAPGLALAGGLKR